MIRRGLLAIALVFALASGCALPAPRSRGDDAGVVRVPVIPMPHFDGVLSFVEWERAALVNGSFSIRDGSDADGDYPFSLRVGATREALVLGIEVRNGTPNPFNTPEMTLADHLWLFFTMNAEGNLTQPSFGIAAATYPGSSFTSRHFWNGRQWEPDPSPDGLQPRDGEPSGGTWAIASAGNGTTSWEVYTPRHPVKTIRNGLVLAPEAAFRMAVLYMRQGDGTAETKSPHQSGNIRWPHDVYPGDGYAPFGMLDAKDWLKLRMA